MGKDFKLESVRVLIGLGNPGSEYEFTYHNAGRMFVEDYARAPETSKWRGEPSFEYTTHGGLKLCKTRVFMNESGKAVADILNYFKTAPEEAVIVNDDTDLPAGSYKIEMARGAAGHKGVENIINTLKTKGFWRLRIGVRRDDGQGNGRRKAADIVLKKMNADEKRILEENFKKIREDLNF